ncbi:MAG TPA: exodeoxyribonuclease VII large subunit [Chthoniobacterales bacterium]|nr:exodeoxyribonuclease VII large subunit [Chthoniobacterales bacterium]
MSRRISENQGQLSFDMEPLKPVASAASQTLPRTRKAPLKTESQQVLTETSSPKLITVTEITRRIALLLEEGIGEVWIEGEISNYRRQASGHHYFTLKDAGAQIACVLFARSASSLKDITLEDGMAVQIYGEVTVYQPRGQYQIVVRLVQPKGQGMLQAKFEALKQRLTAEGLFDTARKRPLPRFPQRIGIVTSPTGAAIADFLHVLHRRHPGLHVVINPVRVQGRGAAQEIASAITEFSQNNASIGSVDVIVVTRGGGSIEDLWEFNEEVVARAIVASTVPVVSAVGHEIDFTICDFAADLRVPTPSAAAELLAADRVTLLEKVNSLVMRLSRETSNRIELSAGRILRCERSFLFREPERLFAQVRQTLDYLEESLKTHIHRYCERLTSNIATAVAGLRASHPRHRLFQARERQLSLQRQLNDTLTYRQHLVQAQVERLRSSLAALSPKATLVRGFTITRDAKGTVLTSFQQVQQGELIQTEFTDGKINSVVT